MIFMISFKFKKSKIFYFVFYYKAVLDFSLMIILVMIVFLKNVEGEHHEKAVDLLKAAKGILLKFNCRQFTK